MAYDQYMYPMEQPGYQAPPMPGAFEWLMNNPYVGCLLYTSPSPRD